MAGKYARVEALSPRPDGVYRFAIRMKGSVPMSVTIEALGVWEIFNITTSWAEYTIQIDEPEGNYIDLYPLSDASMQVEKMQLTYGKDAYEWRPAPEDNVTYEWTCVTLDEAKIANVRDIVSYTVYYCLADADDPIPSAPTTNPPPSPWTAQEPTSGMYEAEATVTGEGISGAIVTASTFASAVNGAAGIYRATYDGASWRMDGDVISLQSYGILVSGTPVAGDAIKIVLVIRNDMVLYQCAVTVYSDESFSWSEVTRSISYDTAIAAVNTSVKYQSQVEQLLDSWSVRVRATIVDNDTGETMEERLGRVLVTESTVSSLIDEVYKNDEGLDERITSLQLQTAQDITNTFTEAKQYADDQYRDTKEYVVTAQSWQRFSADGIEQGKLGSPFKSKLTNEELGFYENDAKVAYISNQKLMITQGQIVDSLIIGCFEFAQGDGGLGILYNGSGGS